MRNPDAAAQVSADLIEAGLNEPVGFIVLWGFWFGSAPMVADPHMDMQIDGARLAGTGVDLSFWRSVQWSGLSFDCLVERSEPP